MGRAAAGIEESAGRSRGIGACAGRPGSTITENRSWKGYRCDIVSRRQSGILFPVFSLPGKYGIGCFSEEARGFIDFLKEAGQSYWQILPLGPTGYGDSPYQAFSTFAGNPYFISLEALISQGLLSEDECTAQGLRSEDLGDYGSRIDYGLLYEKRWSLLRTAFGRSRHAGTKEYADFCRENEYWLEDYALFMAVKNAHGGAALEFWEEDIRTREESAMKRWKEKEQEEIDFYCYLQFEFMRQWKALKQYASGAGIEIIGDIPIYVSADSSDFWAHPDLFQVDERGRIRKVAGVPPDGFSADGQLWGNPLYDWPAHRESGYDWWIRRIGKCTKLYDVIRLDHFRGFDECFAVPAQDKTAANGHWEQGPGMSLFNALKEKYPDLRIIAEDLGYVTDTVRALVRDSGYPNMKVLEFAFDSRDSTGRFEYLPYNFQRNCVVYTGTHDNETLAGWLSSILPEEKAEAAEYFGVTSDETEEYVDKMVRAAMGSVADLCVIPLQDYLALDNRARINHPSTTGTNWTWRASKEMFSASLAQRIRRMTELYGRN